MSASASSLAQSELKAIVSAKADELVGLFYNTFLKDEEASTFLSQSVVHNRLSHSLRNWLMDLLQADICNDHAGFADR
jgi:hypothetical protein